MKFKIISFFLAFFFLSSVKAHYQLDEAVITCLYEVESYGEYNTKEKFEQGLKEADSFLQGFKRDCHDLLVILKNINNPDFSLSEIAAARDLSGLSPLAMRRDFLLGMTNLFRALLEKMASFNVYIRFDFARFIDQRNEICTDDGFLWEQYQEFCAHTLISKDKMIEEEKVPLAYVCLELLQKFIPFIEEIIEDKKLQIQERHEKNKPYADHSDEDLKRMRADCYKQDPFYGMNCAGCPGSVY